MSEKYHLLIYYVHSYLESVRTELHYDEKTTVDNFRDNPVNNKHCLDAFSAALTQWEYELSWNQVANGINLFLKANQPAIKNPHT
jgi:hypothetical protein